MHTELFPFLLISYVGIVLKDLPSVPKHFQFRLSKEKDSIFLKFSDELIFSWIWTSGWG